MKSQEYIAKWIAASNLPFNETKSSHFKDMLKYFHQKSVKIPSANTVKSCIMDLSEKRIEDT